MQINAPIRPSPGSVVSGTNEMSEKLLGFVRSNQVTATRAGQTAIHMLPLVIRPGVFPQGFYRIVNVGDLAETIRFTLADDDGNVDWSVEVDTRPGETRHVNSNDLAGWTDKWGIRTEYSGENLGAEKTYVALGEDVPRHTHPWLHSFHQRLYQ